MKGPLGVSSSKGNQGTTRGKEKFFLTSIRSTVTLPTELRGRTEKVGVYLREEKERVQYESEYECCVAQHYEHRRKWWNR